MTRTTTTPQPESTTGPPAPQQQQPRPSSPTLTHNPEPTLPVLSTGTAALAPLPLSPPLSLSSSSRPSVVPLERTGSVRTNHTVNEEETKVSQLKAELRRQRHALESLEIERQQYRNDCRALNDRVGQVKDRLQQRQQDRQQLQKNYESHLQHMRATDDDLNTIAQKIRHLRQTIAELADELLENVDPKQATLVLREFWLNLQDPISRLGMPLMLNQIRMLTEKYMMDYLIVNMTPTRFPVLRPHQEYDRLEIWLRNHDRYAAVRLRQEIARIIVSGKHNTMRRQFEEDSKQTSYGLYKHLCEAYPYMEQHDKAEPDPSKRYDARVRGIINYSLDLGFAMKGQEVDIAARLVEEGRQKFEPAIMEEEQGLTSGTIEFCICPPFVAYNTLPFTLLEKGRVYCSPHRQDPKQAPQQA